MAVIKHMNGNKCTVESTCGISRLSGILTAFAVLVLLLMQSCAQGTESLGPPYRADLLPPMLVNAAAKDGRTILLEFDEEAFAMDGDFAVTPSLEIASAGSDENQIHVIFDEDQAIGESYILKGSVSDKAGNILTFLYTFSGWNPRIPDLLINEINPRGSGNTPDCVELFALKDGNLGGLYLTLGTQTNYSEALTFPAVEIDAGDFILVHAKSEGLAEEVDELDQINASGGLLATDTARDFWIPGSPGLPGNNGAVTLYAHRGGPVLDAVLWSDRSYDAGDDELGWTSAGYDFAVDLGAASAWEGSSEGIPTPSDAVDVSVSTATRSLCRASSPEDSDSRSDWHTVPTRGQSFGSINSDQVHVP